MSDAVLCDRCGRAFNPKEEGMLFERETRWTVKRFMNRLFEGGYKTIKRADLCQECAADFDEFMGGADRLWDAGEGRQGR